VLIEVPDVVGIIIAKDKHMAMEKNFTSRNKKTQSF